MKKCCVLMTLVLQLGAMENDLLPRSASERCCLVDALARAAMERLPGDGRLWVPVHPKVFIHYIVQGEIVDEDIVDAWLSDEYYLTECVLAQPVFEQTARVRRVRPLHLTDEQAAVLGWSTLSAYRAKMEAGYRSLEVLLLVQDYIDVHSD